MREIKFRAWDKDEQSMNQNVESGIYCDPDEVLGFDHILGLACYEVMQFTGLKDKNGREIYEGDIVTRVYNSGSSFVGEVIFGEATYFMRNDEQYAFLANQYDSETLEVIGNIYENPELLEVTE